MARKKVKIGAVVKPTKSTKVRTLGDSRVKERLLMGELGEQTFRSVDRRTRIRVHDRVPTLGVLIGYATSRRLRTFLLIDEDAVEAIPESA